MTKRKTGDGTSKPWVDGLRNYGPTRFVLPWRNYVQDLDLDQSDISKLLEIATGKPGKRSGGAAIHARRALAELGSIEVLDPVIALARSDDGAWLDLPAIAGMIGADALPLLGKMLRTLDSADADLAEPVVHGIMLIAIWHPPARDKASRLLCDQLRAYSTQNRILNGLLLGAIKAIPGRACPDIVEELERLPAYAEKAEMRSYPTSRQGAMRTASPE